MGEMMDRMMNMLMDLVSQLTNLAVALVGLGVAAAVVFDKNTVIRRPVQHLIPLEISEIHNKRLDSNSSRPRRQAAMNADVIRKLNNC